MSGSKAIGWLAMWLQTDTLVWLLSRLLSLRMYFFLVLVGELIYCSAITLLVGCQFIYISVAMAMHAVAIMIIAY